MKKRILSMLLAMVMVIGMIPVIASADEVAQTATQQLSFNSDGKFKIVVFADCQDDATPVQSMIELIGDALDRENPDLVVFTGDNVSESTVENFRIGASKIIQPLIERNIPYAYTFGNHDDEYGVSKEQMHEVYQSLGNCLTYDAAPAISGFGNCNLPIYSSNGSDIAFNLWIMDSLTYDGNGGYNYVQADQLAWYKDASAALEQQAGHKVNSIMFQHIALPEIYNLLVEDANGSHTYNGKKYSLALNDSASGYLGEFPCPPTTNGGQFAALKERGDVLGVVTGHDHSNCFEGTYDGIRFTQMPGMSIATYGDDNVRGYGVIELDESNTSTYTTTTRTYGEFSAETPKITKVSMTLNGVLDVNFKVASNGADMSKASVAITGAAAQTVSSYTREGDLYVYTVKVPAHLLSEDLNVALMYDGTAVQSATWTAWDSYLSKLTGDEQALAAALNSYGTYAAAYAKGEAGTAISGVTAEQLAAYKPVFTVNNGELGAAVSLYLDDAADLRVKFNEAAWQEGYQLKIDGENANVVSNGNGKLVYTKENLLPQAWSHMYDIQVVSGEETVYQVSYGVYSYIRAALRNAEEATPGLNNLLKSMHSYGSAAVAYQPDSRNPIALGAISLRDPFILNDGNAYYLYGTGANGKLNVWSSTDLNYWVDEGACFTVEAGDAYYDTTNSEVAFWAPEVFAYNGAYYMFATFTQAGTGNQQGTAILKADSPAGPFTKWSDGFVTPVGHSALDGTLYIENGTPYMIYCHEWECSCLDGTGTVEYIQLSADLKSTVGNSAQLFAANQFSWGNIFNRKYSTVTDGVHVYTKDGTNYLQWSTSINGVYTVAYTTFETLAGGVSGTHTKLYEDNGGHGMIFTDMNGVDKLVLHTPNSGAAAYPAIFNVSISDSRLVLEGVHIWDGYQLAVAQDHGTKVYNAETTLFIGDSFFDKDFWTTFNTDLAGKDARIFGIGGSTAEDWIGYMESGAFLAGSATSPRNIVINIGNNDVFNDIPTGVTVEQVLENMQTMLTMLKENYPSANLYLYSITPRSNVDTANMLTVNAAMEAWCGSNGVTYLNIYSQLNGDSMLKDGIHPKNEYYNSVFLATLTAAGCQIADFVGLSETLTTHSGTVSFDKYDGGYTIPTGSAVTGTAYAAAEIEATFVTPGWPIMGFAIMQGSNEIKFQFGSCGYDGGIINVKLGSGNGNVVGSIPTAFDYSLASNTSYEMKMVFDGVNINIYLKQDGLWTKVNAADISLDAINTMVGGVLNTAQPISIGLAGSNECGGTFTGIAVTEIEPVELIPQLLTVTEGVSYNAATGVYNIPTGYAMTAETYSAVEFKATLMTAGWPIQGFVVKNGSNTVKFKFGSCGYDGDKIFTIVNDGVTINTATDIAFSPASNTTYDLILTFDGTYINITWNDNGTLHRINAEPIDLAALIGSSYNASAGISVGVVGWSDCGDSFGNISVTKLEAEYPITYAGLEGATHTNPATYFEASAASTALADPSAREGYKFLGWYINGVKVTSLAGQTGAVTITAQWEAIPELPQVFGTLSGATYDKYSGVYSVPTGYALTSNTYQAAELDVTFVTAGWPIQGFAWKQGDNILSVKFGSCGYGEGALEVLVNGNSVGNIGATNSSLYANTRYQMRMIYNNGRIEIMMLSGGSWVAVNSATISMADYISGFDASAGVQVGVMGWSDCGDSFTDVSVTEGIPTIPDLLSVKDGATYNETTGIYTIPTGSALTAESYTQAELTASFMTNGWPIQGFAWKQGANTVSVKFGSCGYGNDALEVLVNGTSQGTIRATNSSLNANKTYEMKMVFNGTHANIFMKIDGAWMRVNVASIDIADYMGSSFDASAGVQIGVMGWSDCGDSFGNIAISNAASAAEDVLSVKDGATFDSVSGLYSIPTGTAMTDYAYTNADMRARFVTDGWPIQGFAWKQGNNTVSVKFGSCGYGEGSLEVLVNGNSVGYITASNSSLAANTCYNMKMTFDGEYANIYMDIGGTWTLVNASPIHIAGYLGSSYNASKGVSVGLIGWSDCGAAYDSITVIGEPLEISEDWELITDLSVLNNASGNYRLASDVTCTETISGFTGTLDGNGKTIRTTVPVFDTLNNSETVIKDLKVVLTADLADRAVLVRTVTDIKEINNVEISAENGAQLKGCGDAGRTAVFVASAVNAKLVNCINRVDVIAGSDYYVGSMVGAAESSGTTILTGCVNYGTIEGDEAGGIIGRARQSAKIYLTDCINNGDIVHITHSWAAGGILGRINDSGCYAEIVNCTNNGDVVATGGNLSGSIVGYAQSDSVLIRGCTNNGTVGGSPKNDYVGSDTNNIVTIE